MTLASADQLPEGAMAHAILPSSGPLLDPAMAREKALLRALNETFGDILVEDEMPEPSTRSKDPAPQEPLTYRARDLSWSRNVRDLAATDVSIALIEQALDKRASKLNAAWQGIFAASQPGFAPWPSRHLLPLPVRMPDEPIRAWRRRHQSAVHDLIEQVEPRPSISIVENVFDWVAGDLGQRPRPFPVGLSLLEESTDAHVMLAVHLPEDLAWPGIKFVRNGFSLAARKTMEPQQMKDDITAGVGLAWTLLAKRYLAGDLARVTVMTISHSSNCEPETIRLQANTASAWSIVPSRASHEYDGARSSEHPAVERLGSRAHDP